MAIQDTILKHLIHNKEYSKRVLPYILDEYFEDRWQAKFVATYRDYIEKYRDTPSVETLGIAMENRDDFSEDEFKKVSAFLKNADPDKNTDLEWLVDETEKFCQERAIFNAIQKSIQIMQGEEKKLGKGAIPNLLTDALSVNFDTHIGHDYLEDIDSRFEFYHSKEDKIEFDIDILNLVTKGGVSPKSITVFLAETGAGKSIVKCHFAATHLMYGKNVLYITMELSEEMVAKRIDMNLLDMDSDKLVEIPKMLMQKKIDAIKQKTPGRLVVKEYPTASANVGHFRHLLHELKFKKNFKPDVIYVDYVNLCASTRFVAGSGVNSYTLVKAVTEELRGLGIEFGVPIISSSQINRGGYGNSDVDLTNVSESMGLAHTCDAVFALITSEELQSMDRVMFKQLKNRWGPIDYFRRFHVGMDKSRMRLYNIDMSAQQAINNPEDDDKKKSGSDVNRIDPLRKKRGGSKLFGVEGIQ